MEVISSSFLKEVSNGSVVSGTIVNGVILVSDYRVALTKNNKEYISGSLKSGSTVSFKAWGNSTAFTKMKTEEYSNIPVFIRGTVDVYNDVGSIILDDISAVEGYTADQFLEQKYNAEAYYNALYKLLEANLSPKALELYNKILTGEVLENFKYEFAASSHHDNCKSGLLAHTYKCLSLMNWLVTTYKGVSSLPSDTGLVFSQDRKDLLFLGTVLHDIGKTREMNYGVYQRCAKVTHRFLGIEFFSEYKNDIISAYDEDWYYDLVSIILQHHGEFGDPCRTIVSYVVSKVDLLESQMTFIQQLMPDCGSVDKINIDGTWLTL